MVQKSHDKRHENDDRSPVAPEGQHELVRHLRAAFSDDARVSALLLAGSFGSGTSDAWSDVDFVAVVPPGERDAFVRDWLASLEAFEAVVFVQRPPSPVVLVNAILASWLRCDLLVLGEDEALFGRSQQTVEILLDRCGIADRLPAELPDVGPDRQRVRGIIKEFLRVLGLLSVVVGRGEHAVGVSGAGILRSLLIALLVEDAAVANRGGALRVNRLLTPDQRTLVEGLPAVAADRESVVAAHVAIAGAFLPLARPIAARLDLPWPEAFEDATRACLLRELGVALPGAF